MCPAVRDLTVGHIVINSLAVRDLTVAHIHILDPENVHVFVSELLLFIYKD